MYSEYKVAGRKDWKKNSWFNLLIRRILCKYWERKGYDIIYFVFNRPVIIKKNIYQDNTGLFRTNDKPPYLPLKKQKPKRLWFQQYRSIELPYSQVVSKLKPINIINEREPCLPTNLNAITVPTNLR